jgi:hypothetical protein
MTFVYTIALTIFTTFASVSAIATPEASPVTDSGCEDLPGYFLDLAELTGANSGYVTVTSDPAGVFDLPPDESRTISASLDELIIDLEAIVSPPAAASYHNVFVEQVTWYRDLVTAEDFAAHQRIVNRDKKLVPAMSRAIFAGQVACGADIWFDAYNDAFGEKP